MHRLRLTLACGLGLLLGCGADGAPPDLVLVTLDTTRADHLGPYGYEASKTPVLDAFAESAVVYERAYASSSWTLPSHASLFTGLLPMQHGAQATAEGVVDKLGYRVRPLAEHFRTLAELLSGAGYRTVGIVAGPALGRELGVAQGFDAYEDRLSGKGETLTGRRAQDVADLAVAAVAAAGAKPLFLFVNFFDPHAPYRPPPPHDRGLPDPENPEIGRAMVTRLEAGAPTDGADVLPEWERDALAAMREGYDAEISYLDLHLGRLLDALEQRGRPALIAVTSDHGESFGEHHFLSHGAHLYEDNVRVPLLVQWPDRRGAGSREAAPVQNHRLFPTLLAAAGVEVPTGIATRPLGGDAAPVVIEVRRSDANVRLFGDFFDRDLRAIRDEGYKLIESSRGDVWLFDLEADPGEGSDLAAAEPERVAGLAGRLARIAESLPPLYDPEARAELSPETEEALRALGYLE